MLLNKIKDMRLTARKNKAPEATLLTTLYSEAATIGKNDGSRESTDAEVVAVIKKFIKNSNEIKTATDNKSDAWTTANDEIVFMSQLLPQQLDEEELATIIDYIVHANAITNMQQMGVVMKELKEEHDGLYDGKTASTLVKQAIHKI